MTQLHANAYPRKHFFLEMFTRDISLEDCILDLIDNSIDGLVRSRDLNITSSLLTARGTAKASPQNELPRITVTYSEGEFKIEDNCGGIDRGLALNGVFNFGHEEGEKSGMLGVYGIGLKRAIFKIGNHFTMESKTINTGFNVDLDVKKWSEKDDGLDDWKIDLDPTDCAKSKELAGTVIRIAKLREEVKARINDGVLGQKLHTLISQTYALFLGRYVNIYLNGSNIQPHTIPIGRSDDIKPGHEQFDEKGVKVQLFASVAARNESNEWTSESAGWYALCNGRVVLAADKTELTGWGVSGAPTFHPKYRGFVGIVYFQSANALNLPWTTTKRGINRESFVFLRARGLMKGLAKPILGFLDKMYQQDAPEEPFARQIASQVKQTTLAEVSRTDQTAFAVNYRRGVVPTTIKIQYSAEISDVEKIKKNEKRSSWSATRVGKFTFDHYIKTECPE